jgi:hypothetical protein
VAALPTEPFERACTWTITAPMLAAEAAAVLTANAWLLLGGAGGWALAGVLVRARIRLRAWR